MAQTEVDIDCEVTLVIWAEKREVLQVLFGLPQVVDDFVLDRYPDALVLGALIYDRTDRLVLRLPAQSVA